MAVTLERRPRERQATRQEQTGNAAVVDILRSWGVTFFAGVNGGGVVHVAKHMEPFADPSQANDGVSRMLTMSEYVAGFVDHFAREFIGHPDEFKIIYDLTVAQSRKSVHDRDARRRE